MSERKVVKKVQGMATQDGAGVSLKRILGQPALRNLDPFLMLDEFGSDNPGEYIAGFPEHPHRGFQTVTYMLEGKMRHQDSAGNSGVIQSGGIQWMNAGRGIIHSEMPEQTEGLMRGFQLWINLPASEKMSAPGYQDIPASQVPELTLDNGVSVKVLAGEFDQIKGPVSTQSVKPLFYDLAFSEDAEQVIDLPIEHQCFCYCYEGCIEIVGEPIVQGELAVFSKGNKLRVKGNAGARLIVLAARPIGEPVVQYGPFVMNTEAEIHQAMMDYRSGRLVG